MVKTKQEVELEASRARDLLSSPAWKIDLEPWLTSRIESLKEDLLLNKKPEEIDVIRGQAIALKRVIAEVYYRARKSGSDVLEPEEA